MNVSITFRHMDASEAIKSYASDKIGKLQKFLRQPMTAKVTLSIDRLKQVAEVQISSGGAHLEAKEDSDDLYASIDSVIGKLERQIRGTKGAAQAKRRGSETVRVAGSLPGKTARATKKVPTARKAPAKTAKKAKR